MEHHPRRPGSSSSAPGWRGRSESALFGGVRPRAPCRRAGRGRDRPRMVRRAGRPGLRLDRHPVRQGRTPAPPARRPRSHPRYPSRSPGCASWPFCSARGSGVVWPFSPRSDWPGARSRARCWRCPACFGHGPARPSTSGTTRSTGANAARAVPGGRLRIGGLLILGLAVVLTVHDARSGRGRPLGSVRRSFAELHEPADPWPGCSCSAYGRA